MYFKTQDGADYQPLAFYEKEVVPQKSINSNDVVFQFVARCTDGYYLSLCHFPHGCHKNSYTSFKIWNDENSNTRGYYEQLVQHLLPCSVFKWEISAIPNNISFFEEFLFTEFEESSFEFFLDSANVVSVDGKISLTWILTQPCINEYEIMLCQEKDRSNCWTGYFKRPMVDSDDDLLVDIEITSIKDFEYNLKTCSKYEIIVKPIISGHILSDEYIIPFTFVENVQPPVSLEVNAVTSESIFINWVPNECFRASDVLIHMKSEGKIVQEYQIQANVKEYTWRNLKSCTKYEFQVYGYANKVRSERFQSMSSITHPNSNTSDFEVKTHSNSIEVIFGDKYSKCIKEWKVTSCETISRTCDKVIGKCVEMSNSNETKNLIFEDLQHSAFYKISFEALLFDKTLLGIKTEICSKTKFGGNVRLNILENGCNFFKLELVVDDLEMDLLKNINVTCKSKASAGREELGIDLSMFKSYPDAIYFCEGHFMVDGDLILIPEMSVPIPNDIDIVIDLQVDAVETDTFR